MMQFATWLNSDNAKAGAGAASQPQAVTDSANEVNGPEVVAVGLSRTATRSLQIGLTKLGMGPCYHTSSLLYDDGTVEDAEVWLKAYSGLPADLQSVLKKYRSTLGSPANDFYEKIMELYPNAKVILQTREPRSWAESVDGSIGKWHWHPPLGYAIWDVLPNVKLQRKLGRSWHAKAEKKDGTHDIDPEYITRWNAEVLAKVPADKLLVWNAKEGYAPICEFLGLPTPIEPFPHKNDRQEAVQVFGALTLLCHILTICWAIAVSASAYFLFWIMSYFIFKTPFSVEAALARRTAVITSFLVVLAQLKSPLLLRLVQGPMVTLRLYGIYAVAGAVGVAALVLSRETLGL